MSMLPFRVLCLLAIILYCVGVANANPLHPKARFIAQELKKAHGMMEETVKNKEECKKAVDSAQGAARNAHAFVVILKNSLQELVANRTEVAKKKKEGEELIKTAEKAAKKVETVGEKTSQNAEDILYIADLAQDAAQEHDEPFRQLVDKELADMKMNMTTIMTNAQSAGKGAHEESSKVYTAVKDVEAAVQAVKDALKELDAAVAAGQRKKEGKMKQKEKKQVNSQLTDTQEKSTTTTAENAINAANGAQAGSSEFCIDAEVANAALEEVKNAIKKLEEQAGSNEVCIDAEVVNAALKEVKNAIKKLEAAVAAADGKKVKLKVSQAQSQTRDPTVAGQQEQRSGDTITVNIRGENIDALFNDAKNKSGMALQDGSSVPALLRVPLLLLLLFSVLGCMTVC